MQWRHRRGNQLRLIVISKGKQGATLAPSGVKIPVIVKMSASMGSSIIQSRSWHEDSGSNEPEQWSRHAPQHVHDALVSDACRNRYGVAGKTFPAFPAQSQPAILRIWQEAYSAKKQCTFCSRAEGIWSNIYDCINPYSPYFHWIMNPENCHIY